MEPPPVLPNLPPLPTASVTADPGMQAGGWGSGSDRQAVTLVHPGHTYVTTDEAGIIHLCAPSFLAQNASKESSLGIPVPLKQKAA